MMLKVKRNRAQIWALLAKKIRVNETTGCWLWIGAIQSRYGYGAAWFEGKQLNAHRAVYICLRGDVPAHLKVCHRNPPCVNPDHMFVGTQTDNMQDALSKGRFVVGSRHFRANIGEDRARAIKERFAQGERQCDIARALGVDPRDIHRIVRNETWKHVPWPT